MEKGDVVKIEDNGYSLWAARDAEIRRKLEKFAKGRWNLMKFYEEMTGFYGEVEERITVKDMTFYVLRVFPVGHYPVHFRDLILEEEGKNRLKDSSRIGDPR